jgi:hypothetical protein
VGAGAAEGGGVCLEVGAVGAEDCAILEPEPVTEHELLDLPETACAAAELGGDPADRAEGRDVAVELRSGGDGVGFRGARRNASADL